MKQQIFSIFILAIFLFGTSSVQAQTKKETDSAEGPMSKGKHMITIMGGFYSQGDGTDDDRITVFNLNLDYRIFVIKGLAFGVDLDQESAVQGDYNQQILRIGPEIAYFFGKPDGFVIPYVSTTFGFLALTDNTFYNNDPLTGSRYNFGGGILFNSSKRVGGLMQLSFQEDIYKEGSQTFKLNQFALTMGISISLR